MTRHNRVLAILAAAALASQALPARAQQIAGFGTARCDAWVTFRQPGVRVPNPSPDLALGAQGVQQWVLGYLSGIASGSAHIVGSHILDPMAGMARIDQIWSWIDIYCSMKPTEFIAQAAVEFLFFQLRMHQNSIGEWLEDPAPEPPHRR